MRTGWHVAGGVAAALVVFIAIEAQQAEPRRIATAPAFDARRASNYAEMASELHIVDAQRMEDGAVAVVKLPFRLRGGTHVNWFSADELAAQRAETV